MEFSNVVSRSLLMILQASIFFKLGWQIYGI